jgi:hypothetical protein
MFGSQETDPLDELEIGRRGSLGKLDSSASMSFP